MREAKVETCCVQVDKPRGMLGGDILPEKHVFLLQKRDSIFLGLRLATQWFGLLDLGEVVFA